MRGRQKQDITSYNWEHPTGGIDDLCYSEWYKHLLLVKISKSSLQLKFNKAFGRKENENRRKKGGETNNINLWDYKMDWVNLWNRALAGLK